jgi:hypothetical protein
MIENLKPRALSKKAVRELLTDSNWQPDQTLQNKLKNVSYVSNTIYSHPDGQVLSIYGVTLNGILYPSCEPFEQWLHDFAQENARHRQQPARHLLEDRLSQGEDFPEHIPHLIEEMAKQLKLKSEQLNGSVESLMNVDKAIKRYGKSKSLEIPVFPGLVAYTGETMRRAVRGRWEMRLDDHAQKTWEPWVVDPHGNYCNPFMAVYDELFDSRGFSIYSSTTVRINMRRPLPSGSPHLLTMTITGIIPKDPGKPD